MDSRLGTFVALLLVALLAGCAQPDRDVVKDAPASAPLGTPIVSTAAFHWRSNELQGDAVLQVAIAMQKDSQCSLGTKGSTDASRTDLVLVETFDGVSSWASGNGFSGFKGTFSGDAKVTMLLPGATTAQEGELVGASAAIDIVCDKTFDVIEAKVGHEFLVAQAEELQQAGLASSLSITQDAQVGATFASPEVRIGYLAVGDQNGELQLTHPDGLLVWNLHPWSQAMVDGGAGDYSFTLDRTAVNYSNIWLVGYGLTDPFDLQTGLIA